MTQESPPLWGSPGPQGIGFQLHTLASLDVPLEDVIRRVAAAGYDGVEFAGRLFDTDPAPVRSTLVETGTTPIAAHVGLARLESDPEAVLDRCRAVGCQRLVIPHVGAGHFRTTGRVDGLANRLTALLDRLDLDSVDLEYHTQLATFSPLFDQFALGWTSGVPIPGGGRPIAAGIRRAARLDGADIEGRTAFGRLLERTPPELSVQVDVGWVAAAGYDPVDVFDVLGPRLGTIHVTDVTATGHLPRRYDSVPPGEGIVDLARVLSAARASDADWLVYENDDPEKIDLAIEHGAKLLGLDALDRRDGRGDVSVEVDGSPRPGSSL